MSITTQLELEAQIIANPKLILDFQAPWCAPCTALGKILESLEPQMKALGIALANVNVDTENGGAVAETFGIRGLPSLVFLRQGSVVTTLTAARTREQLLAAFAEHLA